MRELDASDVETLLDAQQAAVDQQRERVRPGAGFRKPAQQALFGDVFAKAGNGQQIVLDDVTHRGRLVGEGALVEIGENRGMRASQQIKRDIAAALRDARVIQLPTDEAQERGLNLRIGELRPAGDEAHDRGGHLVRHQLPARLQHGRERLGAGHGREPQAVLRDAGDFILQAFERRQIVLAQRDQHAIVAAREIKAAGRGLIFVELRLERLGRAVLDQVRKLGDEARRPGAAEFIALGESEELLELVEDQERNQGRARLIAQHVVAMVQKLPQRLARDRYTHLGPLARQARGLPDRLFDLLGRLGRVPAVIDAHVDRAVPLAAQTGHESGTQDRGLAEARLTEQQRQELALHAARELGDLLLAAEEERARLLGEGSEPQPRIAFIDLTGRIGRRQFRNRVHRERARMKSSRRCAKSAGTCPPGSWLKCSALNLSGTRASAAVVASMLTGRMNNAPSAMLRTRSMA